MVAPLSERPEIHVALPAKRYYNPEILVMGQRAVKMQRAFCSFWFSGVAGVRASMVRLEREKLKPGGGRHEPRTP